MGSKAGVTKVAAKKTGCTPEEWESKRARGYLWCYSCRTWKLLTSFGHDRTRGSGRMSVCRPCNSERSTASRYGITVEKLRGMHRDQCGACPICSRVGHKLEVDHDHATGEVRALLCSKCNGALGQFNDDVALLAKAIVYLEDHRG